jgi:hypothetical protein
MSGRRSAFAAAFENRNRTLKEQTCPGAYRHKPVDAFLRELFKVPSCFRSGHF